MQIKWLPVVKTRASLLFQWFVFEGHKEKYYLRSLGLSFGLKHQKIVNNEISIDFNEFAQLENILTSRIRKDKNYLEKFISACNKYSSKLIKISEDIKGDNDLMSVDNKKLLEIYRSYQDAVLALMPFLNTILVIDEILKKELVKYLETDLKIKDKNEQELLLSKLIIPMKKSYFVEETETLFNLAFKFQQNLNIEKEIKEYIDKFAWSSSVAYLGKFQTREDVIKKLQNLINENLKDKLKINRLTKKEITNNYVKALKIIGKSKKLLSLVKISQELLYLQTYRLDIFSLSYFKAYSLFKEIAKRFNYQVEELVYLTGKEIIELFEDQRVEKNEIQKRQKNYALILNNNHFSIFSGDSMQETSQQAVYGLEVKGTIANRGRAKGVAKLVFDIKDISKINKGDIIVSPMTRPELVPAIIKSSGIITDFGGILCHAAIVSREFGVPCIVGTKNATKIFKDGDTVELNAYDGVARKILM